MEGAIEIAVHVEMEIAMSWPRWKRQAALTGDLRPTCKPDFDNLCKAFGDAWNGVVWRDDAQITDVMFRKRYGLQPKLIVTVRPAGAAA